MSLSDNACSREGVAFGLAIAEEGKKLDAEIRMTWGCCFDSTHMTLGWAIALKVGYGKGPIPYV